MMLGRVTAVKQVAVEKIGITRQLTAHEAHTLPGLEIVEMEVAFHVSLREIREYFMFGSRLANA